MRQPFFILFLFILAGHSNAALEPTSFLLSRSHDARSDVTTQASSLRNLHRRFAGLSILEISLILVALVAVACVILLVQRFLNQAFRIAQLTKRIQGLQHAHMDNARQLTTDKDRKEGLERQLAKVDEEEKILDAGIVSLEVRQQIDTIVAQGRVHVDIEKKLFTFNRPIAFKRQNIDENTEPPKPQFEDLNESREVLADLASLLLHFKSTVILVEGHTEGGADALGEVFFEVASQRAELVVDTLVSLGISPGRLESRGRPGIIGDNMNDVKIVTLYWGL